MGKMKNTTGYQLKTKKSSFAAVVAQSSLFSAPSMVDGSGKGGDISEKARLRMSPPTKNTGGMDAPPINKMGVTESSHTPKSQAVELVMVDGEVKQVLVRTPSNGQCSIVDWVNITIHEDTWLKTSKTAYVDFIKETSRVLEQIFGFGITVDRGAKLNFYHNSWVIGDQFGFVCYGGQRNTMMITLNGTGCLNAAEGWEHRLYHFLKFQAVRPVITRCDLAHDDFESQNISVDWAEQQWHESGFNCSVVSPNIERKGNWHRPTGAGRTLTIGVRKSGKYTRFYEKGKKEGDKGSKWVRAEVEFKSSDRVIPFEVLINPSDYFLAAYPCFSVFKSAVTPVRIACKKKTAKIAYARALEIMKNQSGKYITFLRQFFNDDELFLSKISHPDKNCIPNRLKGVLASIDTCGNFIHDYNSIPLAPHPLLEFASVPMNFFGQQWEQVI